LDISARSLQLGQTIEIVTCRWLVNCAPSFIDMPSGPLGGGGVRAQASTGGGFGAGGGVGEDPSLMMGAVAAETE
jgi:hypothetical protein